MKETRRDSKRGGNPLYERENTERMSWDELFGLFSLHFIELVNLLFTKINLHTLEDVSEGMFIYLQAYLARLTSSDSFIQKEWLGNTLNLVIFILHSSFKVIDDEHKTESIKILYSVASQIIHSAVKL